jgi:hypothetical protein
MAQADVPPDGSAVDWWHETDIKAEPPRAFVRAFVCHHLMAHRLTALLDIVQVVACELAASALVRAQRPVTLGLSRVGNEVRFEVRGAAPPASPAASEQTTEAWYPSRFVELLSLRWGQSSYDETHNVWVTFDARPERHAWHAARRTTNFTRGHSPGVGGGQAPE